MGRPTAFLGMNYAYFNVTSLINMKLAIIV